MFVRFVAVKHGGGVEVNVSTVKLRGGAVLNLKTQSERVLFGREG